MQKCQDLFVKIKFFIDTLEPIVRVLRQLQTWWADLGDRAPTYVL